MPDSPGTRHAPVDAWEKAIAGIDRDPWLRRFRRSSRTYDSPADALDFYSRVFLEAPIAILILTESNLVADANIAAEQLLKRSLEKLRGKPFLRTVAKEDRPGFLEVAHARLVEAQRYSRPLRLVHPDGTEVDTAMIGSALKNDEGKVEFVILMLLERGENVTSDIL